MNKDILSRIECVLIDAVKEQNIPGASALVVKDGVEEYYCETGYADIENRVPIRRDTIFRLYSMTKPITGTAAMLLMQNGRIDLCDPVSKFLPGFKDQKVHTQNGPVPAERDIKIKDILGMTSGLIVPNPDTEGGRAASELFKDLFKRLDTDKPMTTMELANRLGQCGLGFQPGEYWQYGFSADVMGAVVESVTGKTFGQFLRDELFEPLGMNDTGFYVPGEKQNRLAKTYTETSEGMLPATPPTIGYPISLTMDKAPGCEFGGAGLASTIDDYQKFARMLLNGGTYNGTRILSPKTVEYFTAPQLNDAQMSDMNAIWNCGLAGFNYGNYLRIMTDPGKAMFMGSLGEYGWDGALGVYFLNSPLDNLTFIFMTQRNGSGTMPVTRKVRNIVFSAL